jgi:hypothetical protein
MTMNRASTRRQATLPAREKHNQCRIPIWALYPECAGAEGIASPNRARVSVMKAVAVVGLVILVLLMGMPMAMSMGGMAPCPDCPATTTSTLAGLCVAVLSFFALLIGLLLSNVTLLNPRMRPSLWVRRLERPPRRRLPL